MLSGRKLEAPFGPLDMVAGSESKLIILTRNSGGFMERWISELTCFELSSINIFREK